MTTLRPFTEDDAGMLLRWRNSDEHRLWSFSPRMIEPREHAAWFDRFFHDSRRVGFIMEDDASAPVGQIRFDPTLLAGMLTVSIGIAPGHMGKGIGTHLLSTALKRPEVAERAVLVRAETFVDNLPSRRIFEKSGFTSLGERERDGHRYIEWLRPVGEGLAACACRIESAGADHERAEVENILSVLGFPARSGKQPGGQPVILLAGGREFNHPWGADETAAGYLVPLAGRGII
ncbi:MAG TPA: GNAT family N-acetyltransferase, partial [Candidatus Ozemobacteraceae bacterium]|nr:GNAT family N-acetyltransferase [Candidatus Ozemobacteraceae bacterium]